MLIGASAGADTHCPIRVAATRDFAAGEARETVTREVFKRRYVVERFGVLWRLVSSFRNVADATRTTGRESVKRGVFSTILPNQRRSSFARVFSSAGTAMYFIAKRARARLPIVLVRVQSGEVGR